MYILKNALISITRNKGRNILIGIIILVIAAISCIALSTMNAANEIVSSHDEKYDVEVTITMNRQNMLTDFKKDGSSQEDNIEKFNDIEELTKDDVENYGNSDYVSNYYYTSSISLNSSNLEPATEEIDPTSDNKFRDNMGIKNERMNEGDFTLIGYSSYSMMKNFIEGTYSITDGTISDDFESDSCIINSELAAINDIEVGDTIILTSPEDDDEKYTLTVTGLYEDDNEESESNMNSMYSQSVNTIITNTTVIDNIAEEDDSIKVSINPTFIMTNKDVIDEFSSELEEKGLSDYYQVTTNLDKIESETESIKNLSNFATLFLAVTLIIGAVVLLVLNMINVRERKYEIGVLRTIGMKKKDVILQFVSELMIVSLIFLIIGAFIGSLLSIPVANKLLEREVASTENQIDQIGENFGKPNMDFNRNNINGISTVEKVTNINAAVNIKVLIELLLIGLALSLFSSASAIASIARFSPMSILKERT